VAPTEPNTTNVVVDQVKQTLVDKIDLVFMIDNSISMSDKQLFLADAVPQLVQRLVNPTIDGTTGKPEFDPINDIHVAVITSSLGGHGSNQCATDAENDRAHLLPTVRTGLASHQDQGFLWWDPESKFGGETNAQTLITNFQAQVSAAGETGCGYEASLESWYRFLIDPDPPAEVVREGDITVVKGRDEALLAQRREFLRPDSLLAVIELTDENDCSIMDEGYGWYPAQGDIRMPRSTSTCETDPDDKCCRPCNAQEPNGPVAGCAPVAEDASCKINGGAHEAATDDINARCWQQKRRFGMDLLHPTRRYVDGLKNRVIRDRAGNDVPNPIYTDLKAEGRPIRDPSLVYFATITGVPWQDIATEDSLSGTGLSYLSAKQLTEKDRWKWLVPNCRHVGADGVCDVWDATDAPDDPLMVESMDPRSGVNPATGEALAPPGSAPDANSINGHEWPVPKRDDLQYACRFQLPDPKDCTLPGGCDCSPSDEPGLEQSPLCQQADGSYGTSQPYAKGYPGTRHLQVAKDFGENSIIASICPRVSTGDKADPNYGYSPAVNAIIDRLKVAFMGKCINRPVDVKDDGTVQCNVVEVTPRAADGSCAPCDGGTNRSDVKPVLVNPVLKQLKATGQCGGESAPACTNENFCFCTIEPADDATACKTEESPADDVIGWCYVDPSQEPDPNVAQASEALVADCNPHRMLRFVGADTPKPASTTFIACLGAPVTGN
jgi:hypothetical protein